MGRGLRDLTIRQIWHLMGPFVMVAAVGFVGLRLYPGNWFAAHEIQLVAHALMVAGIIGIFIELFAANFLIRRVADDLAQKLVGRGLPAELQHHIREITETKIVRDELVKTYSLSEPDSSGRLRVSISLSYNVRNYSDSPESYSPFLKQEAVDSPEFESLDYFIGDETCHYSGADIADLLKIDPETQVHTVAGRQKITLEPIRRNERSVCKVVWRYHLTMPQNYSDLTTAGSSVIGTQIHLVRIPKNLVFVSGGDIRGTMVHAPGSHTWTFRRPFVNGQSIRVWWYPKEQA